MTVTSISTQPNVISQSTDLSAVNWIVDATLNGGGESITGTIDPTQFSDMTQYSSKIPITIRVSALDEYFDYPIVNTGQQVLRYTLEKKGVGQCVNAAYVIPYRGILTQYLGMGTDICIYATPVAVVGNIDNPTNRLSAKIDLEANNKIISKTIDTLTQQSVEFRDSSNTYYGSATWVGNLVTGNSPPNGAYYVATYKTSETQWRISPRTELTNYQLADSTAKSRLAGWRDFPNDFKVDNVDQAVSIIQAELNKVNSQSDLLTGGTSATIGKSQTLVSPESKTSGKVRVLFDDRTVQMMNIRFLLKASWIGISMPVGMPHITSVSCPSFASGSNEGICTVNVENTGKGTGTFYATFTDASGVFQQRSIPSKYTIAPGASVAIPITISHGTSTSGVSKSCLVSVYDYHDSSLRDDEYVTVSMTAPLMCTPGSVRTEGSCVYPCGSNGQETTPLCCQSGTTLQFNESDTSSQYKGWYCKEGNTSFLDSLKQDTPTDWKELIVTILYWIVITLSGIVIVYVGIQFLKGFAIELINQKLK